MIAIALCSEWSGCQPGAITGVVWVGDTTEIFFSEASYIV